MAKWTINDYNARIDRTNTVMHLGKNGVLYEYILPYGGNPLHYYEDAIDVKSHKSMSTKYNNGKRPGEYQPVGDKRYFTFYQLKQIRNRGDDDYLKEIMEIIDRFFREVLD